MTVQSFETLNVRGYLHRPASEPATRGLVMTHGASSNCQAPMLVGIATALCERGWLALRCDLPYRQRRPGGPPRPAESAQDRAGLLAAAGAVRVMLAPQGKLAMGGHSYGGRQASMLAAETPEACDALLLCSYPLHPPGQPDKLRTQHLSNIEVPALFVHGTKDPFGSPQEMDGAISLVPAARIRYIQGAGHDLARGRDLSFLDQLVVLL